MNIETFAKILNGAKPHDLKQEFESPLKIVINLETARKIGFRHSRGGPLNPLNDTETGVIP